MPINGTLIGTPASFSRLSPYPITDTEVFDTKLEAEQYAQTSPVAYKNQIIATEGRIYILTGEKLPFVLGEVTSSGGSVSNNGISSIKISNSDLIKNEDNLYEYIWNHRFGKKESLLSVIDTLTQKSMMFSSEFIDNDNIKITVNTLTDITIFGVFSGIGSSNTESTIHDDVISTDTTYSSTHIEEIVHEESALLKKYSDELIKNINKIKKEVVSDESSMTEEDTLYFILTDNQNNIYSQYMLLPDNNGNIKPINISQPKITMDNYYNKTETDNIINEANKNFIGKSNIKQGENITIKTSGEDIIISTESSNSIITKDVDSGEWVPNENGLVAYVWKHDLNTENFIIKAMTKETKESIIIASNYIDNNNIEIFTINPSNIKLIGLF